MKSVFASIMAFTTLVLNTWVWAFVLKDIPIHQVWYGFPLIISIAVCTVMSSVFAAQFTEYIWDK